MKKYWTHRDESVKVKNREKTYAGAGDGIIQKNIALSVIYMENLQRSQDYSDATEVIGRQCLRSWPIIVVPKTTLAKQFYTDLANLLD